MTEDSGVVPGWVMFGMNQPDGSVRLYASNTLTQAELYEEAADIGAWQLTEPIVTGKTYTITATMKSFVVLVAADWPSAFRALFDRWAPDAEAEPTQIAGSTTRPDLSGHATTG